MLPVLISAVLKEAMLLYKAAQFYKAVDGLRLSVFGYLINTSNM